MELLLNLVVFSLSDITTTDERLRVKGSHRPLRLDEVVHERLRHGRVVALVVSATTVTDEVDHNIVLKRLTIPNGKFGNADDGFGVVAVDVENRGLHRFRDVGGVEGCPCVSRESREPDLVVDDHVNCSAGAVAAQLAHLQGLDDDTLARHCRVSVDEDRQHRKRRNWFEVLFGANDSLEHTVDRFKVRRVSSEIHGN